MKNKRCLRCGKKAEVETDRGYLCFSCDCERLSCIDNSENPKTEEDFWNDISCKNLK